MPDIDQFVGDNIGGLEEFQFIPVTDIISIPRPVDHVINKSVVIDDSSGAKWLNAYVTEGSLGYTETKSKTQHGTPYKRKLVGFVPKDSEALANQFDGMEGSKFVLIYDDNNGKKKLIGSIDSPLEFTADLDTKEDASGRNGHTISFTGNGPHKAYFYNPPVGSSSAS